MILTVLKYDKLTNTHSLIELDSSKEIELFAEDIVHPSDVEFGFQVKLTCKKTEDTEEGEIINYFNVTEYHHLYETRHSFYKGVCAIESDIHGTGCTPWNIFDRFSKIELFPIKEIKTDFCLC